MTKKILSLALAFAASLAIAGTAKAEAITINTDTIWTGEVTVDNGEGVVIANGATLTIAPEAIVKMGANNNIILSGGNLVLAGEASKPAIITALTASSVPGDWGYILASSPSSTISMSYALVEFGGGGDLSIPSFLMIQQAQSVTISSSSLLNNNGSILVYEVGNFVMHNSNIYNPDFCQDLDGVTFCGSSIFNLSETQIDAINNYWGSNMGPTTDPAGDIYGTVIQGDISYIPFLTAAFVPAEPEDPEDPEEPGCGCQKHWWLGCKKHKHHQYKPMHGPWGLIKQGKVTPPVNWQAPCKNKDKNKFAPKPNNKTKHPSGNCKKK